METAKQAVAPTRSTVNPAGMSKLDLRRIQMLTRQKEQLQRELESLRAEVDDLVRFLETERACF